MESIITYLTEPVCITRGEYYFGLIYPSIGFIYVTSHDERFYDSSFIKTFIASGMGIFFWPAFVIGDIFVKKIQDLN